MKSRSFFLALLVSAIIVPVPMIHLAHAGSDRDPVDTTLEHNKAQARRVYEEGLSQGLFEVPYSADFVGHGGSGSTFNHADGIREAKGWRMAFPDLQVSVDLIVGEHDLVSVRWTARGTNSGAGNGIPATGRTVQTSGTTVFRFANGAIAEEWTAGDALGLLKQLGLMPPPATAGPTD